MEDKDFSRELGKIRIDNLLNEGANTSLYEFVANNYNNLTKEQLKELILNLDYILYSTFSKKTYKDLESKAINETMERLKV